MKRYEFKLVVHEGSDEFWEALADKTGCDEVKDEIEQALVVNGFSIGADCELRLVKYVEEEK